MIVPTYNEVENLEPLVRLVLALGSGLSVLVVDDASPDGTGEVAQRLSEEEHGRVSVTRRPAKLGLGTAHIVGFREAIRRGSEVAITMDADFSHDPAYLPALLECVRNGADLAIGSRYHRGGATPDFPWNRVILSGLANLAAHHAAGLRARDATAGLRCYRTALLERLPLDAIRSDGYSFLVEMLFLVQASGFRIAEVPIVFRDRARGTSKISRREIHRAVLTVLRLLWVRIRHPSQPGRQLGAWALGSRAAKPTSR